MTPAPVRDLDALAAQLGRPPTGLAGLRGLTPEQIALLSGLIEATRRRRRSRVDSELAGILPRLPRSAVVRILRGRGG